MTDRELLELAAKGAGYSFKWEEAFGGFGDDEPTIFDAEGFGHWWTPLINDGDAFRLAVRLGICTGPNFDGDASICFGADGRNIVEPMGEDKFASMRRCIVRAAAEIGKAMP